MSLQCARELVVQGVSPVFRDRRIGLQHLCVGRSAAQALFRKLLMERPQTAHFTVFAFELALQLLNSQVRISCLEVQTLGCLLGSRKLVFAKHKARIQSAQREGS